MANLGYSERSNLEDLLEMRGGYVLQFSNSKFRRFVHDTVGIDIYVEKYVGATGSKANRLRAFWDVETDFIVGKLLKALVDISQVERSTRPDPKLVDRCTTIVGRLLEGAHIQDLEAITSAESEPDFEMLVSEIRQAVEADRPQAGLDRLHTYSTAFLRRSCSELGGDPKGNTPLHSLVGEFIKLADTHGLIHSEMTRRILKSSISIFEAFNDVRNNHTFAHANNTLDHAEALLVFNNVASTIRFIRSLKDSHLEATEDPFG